MWQIDQVNNAYVFPGVGLRAIAVKARLFLKECFSRQHGQLPTCFLRSVIRTPIYYHRLSNRGPFRFKWRLRWRSRLHAKGLQVMVVSGRASGVAVATGSETELWQISTDDGAAERAFRASRQSAASRPLGFNAISRPAGHKV